MLLVEVERDLQTSAGRPCIRTGNDLSPVHNRILSGTFHSYTQALGSLPCDELQLVCRKTHERGLTLDGETRSMFGVAITY